MSDLSESTEGFNRFTTILKNLAWWAGILIAISGAVAGFFYISRTDSFFLVIAVVASIGAGYASIRAYVYRRRFKRIVAGYRYIHKLTHELRDAFNGKPSNGQVAKEPADSLVDLAQPMSRQEPVNGEQIKNIVNILDNAAHCFREITGKACYTSLIMPCYDEKNGQYLKSVLYCSDIDPERARGTEPQRASLCKMAFEANEPLLFHSYSKELTKGNFSPTRKDWKKWYQSGFMAHFKVSGEKFGILNIDSPIENTFHKGETQLVAAFADACGLLFNLCEDNSSYALPIYEKSKQLDQSTDTKYLRVSQTSGTNP